MTDTLPMRLDPHFQLGTDNVIPALFLDAVLRNAAALPVTKADGWPTDAEELTLHPAGYWGASKHESEQYIGLDKAHVYMMLSHGTFRVRVVAQTAALADELMTEYRKTYPVYVPKPGPTVYMTFWAMGRHGPTSYRRPLDVPSWNAIEGNYPVPTHGQVADLMAWTTPAVGGQLLLWQGKPGTGKTWAIRGLASEWRQWCEFEYITDPDEMFRDASYLTQVLLTQGGDSAPVAASDVAESRRVPEEKRWRCLVMEDTGELLAADAKQRQGQNLSRLLNTVDGILGQGLRVLLLITTNEELKDLHAAVIRPGRCVSRLDFAEFNHREAMLWLHEHKAQADAPTTATVAELYALAQSRLSVVPRRAAGFV